MQRLRPGVIAFAAGMIGFGILALTYGDFAMVWQPVPAELPWRTALAYASGVLMLACGGGLLFRATAAWAARILFPYLIAWTLLKTPALFVAPLLEAVWLGLGGLMMLLAGGVVLFATLGEIGEDSALGFLSGERGVRLAAIVFGLGAIPVGLSHFFYTQATIDLIPAWMPFKTGWAWLTGAGHLAAGLALLFNVVPRLAAAVETAMVAVFALLVWVPPALMKHDRLSWTALVVTWAIMAATWVLAERIPQRRGAEIAEPQEKLRAMV